MASLAGVGSLELLKGLTAGARVHANLPVSQLFETALVRGEARLAANGALVAYTGARTGRSPKDKFTVDDAMTHEAGRLGQGQPALLAGEVRGAA